MARKRVIEAPRLKSWEDVNDALRQIAEATIALQDIESDIKALQIHQTDILLTYIQQELVCSY